MAPKFKRPRPVQSTGAIDSQCHDPSKTLGLRIGES